MLAGLDGPGGGGEWGEASMLRLFQGVLKGVKELHDSSPPLAHRDIKPENVLLHSDGVSPVLVDFGSMGPAEVRVTSRAQALGVQDEAATFRCETRGGRA
jgi:serine/threonine kinase 16